MKVPPFRRNVFGSCLVLLSISCANAQPASYQDPGKIGDPESWRTSEFNAEWGLAAMKAQYAYAAGYTGKNISIGILDSGYYDKHPGLPASRFLPVTSNGVPGVLNANNNTHGTLVSGTIGAARDGQDMHGVAFNATIYEANTNATDGFLFGVSDPKFPASDAKYFSAAYDALAATGVRIISNSWGSQPGSENYSTLDNIVNAYRQHSVANNGQGTWLNAAMKVSMNGVVNNFSAGNTGYDNASLRGSLPYFHPELEGNWMTTTGYAQQQGQVYNKCGIAKYWCVAAPTGTSSTSYSGSATNPSAIYANFNGTSAAAPHASAALALIMERYPYMTNEQALTVLFTTSQNMEVDTSKPIIKGDPVVFSDITLLKISNSKVPNAIVGWGLVDLQKAMNGPAQFLGRFDYNLPGGQKDIWRNDISQEAIVQRKSEEQAEVNGWQAKKATLPGSLPGDQLATYLGGLRTDAVPLLKKLAASIATGNFAADYQALQGNAVAASVFSRLLAGTTYGSYLDSYAANPAYNWLAQSISGQLTTALNAGSFSIADSEVDSVKGLMQFSYSTANDRVAYLTKKLADPTAYEAGLTKSGAGQLTLQGNNTYTGETRVNGGELVIDKAASIVSASVVNNTGLLTVNGTAGDATVNAGGTLRGTGSVGAATIAAGGTVAPGNSIGTLTVRGDFLQAAGSFYQAEVAPGGASDRIVVGGKAILQGGTIQIVRTSDAPFVFGQRYSLLTATGGIVGTYAGLSGDTTPISLFVGPKLSYDAASAYLDIAQVAPFAAAAATRNQAAAAMGADTLPDASSLKLAVLNLQTGAQARAAFDQLGGELHASAKTALIEDSRFVRDAVLRRLRSAPEANGDAAQARSKDAQTLASVPGRYGVWGQAFGSWGHAGGDANVGRLSRSASGFMGGVDGRLFDEGRIGVVAGVSHTSFDVQDRQASGSSDNYHLGVYGGTEQGPLAVRTGLALTWNQLSTRRSVSFPGFADSLQGSSHARTAQVFGELAYKLKAGGADVEPFANLAHVNLSSGKLRERGGLAALYGSGTDTNVTFSTLGARTSMDFELAGVGATARASLGWRHGFGDLTPQMTSTLLGSAPFTVTGVPVAKNATLAELELDLRVAPRATLRLAYSGQFASKMKDQSVRASLDWKF
ncbi:autotransporter domain-containing protein [Variovorax sp. PAMC26660]|uniref:autotransporter domain-containing protein n=1 Tax=Variovorax sp. PAMC26660 TaxID=2762322 RepID=UPI00164E484B|nr:autotransporter serine protease [Variovorax sp. PAMC26660]QNK69232.1 autotransporter domain-containing protein [Variovorax sp. PAMC26660]